MSLVVYGDRYSLTNTPRPNPSTICRGRCEGMGLVPVSKDQRKEPWRSLWLAEEAKAPYGKRPNSKDRDGYHFVTCPDCKGTGKRPKAKAKKRAKTGER